MKGIDAIISVILLLMISVALVATSYAWFSGLFGTVTAGGTNVTQKGVSGIQTTFAVENAVLNTTSGNLTLSIRNTGTVPIDVNQTPMSIYINNVGVTTGITPLATLAAGYVNTTTISLRTLNDCTKTVTLSVGVGSPATHAISCVI